MILQKYSFGIGDRFGHQGKAQLAALIKAKQPGYGGLSSRRRPEPERGRPDEQGLEITPVWNKSHREHTIIGTKPADTRIEADDAVTACGWDGPYFVDADHIALMNVDQFIESSDFFTLDVADFIGQAADESDVKSFIQKHKKYISSLTIDGIDETFDVTLERLRSIAGKFLLAVKSLQNLPADSIKVLITWVTSQNLRRSFKRIWR